MPEATSDALMGLGMPAQLAALMGANPSVITAVGTTQTGGAPVVKSRNTEVITAGGAQAVVLPAGAGVMEPYFIANQANATAALVFVPAGHTLNGSLNGDLSVAQFKGVILWQYKPKFWASLLSA